MPLYQQLGKKIPKQPEPGLFPWQVNIYANGNYVCGGTLMHKFWVLTHAGMYSSPIFLAGKLINSDMLSLHLLQTARASSTSRGTTWWRAPGSTGTTATSTPTTRSAPSSTGRGGISVFTCGAATQVNKWCVSSIHQFKNLHQEV